MKLHRGEGLDVRVRRNTLFIAIAAELSPNHVCRRQCLDGFEESDLFIAHGFRITADRSVHGKQHQHLQHVVLYDVANCSDLFIKPPAAFDAKTLGQGDLHACDVVAVPDRFKKGVRKSEVEQILDRFLSKEVIDAANRRLRKELMDRAVQRLRRREIAAERFFDNNPSVFCAFGFGKTFCNPSEHARGDSEIMQRPLRIDERLMQAVVRGLIVVIAVDVLKTRSQFSEGIGVESAVLLDAVASPVLQLIQVPAGLRHSDDRHIQVATLDHCLQRRKNLLVRQISGGPEKNKRIRLPGIDPRLCTASAGCHFHSLLS